ncbi:DUF4333 domain-containing protein [Streptomyces massasporeus]|uniref:DUF4333 domain-containing protein n=1 Tax=Streptomyces massasporeus TaxID=67324 RepID=UPI0036769FC8
MAPISRSAACRSSRRKTDRRAEEAPRTSSGTTTRITGAEVEKQVRENYSLPLVQQKPKAVSCAGGLKARQGDSVACTVTAQNEKKQDILVSVTEVDGSKVSYDFVLLAD